jgi:hypothetical protein
MAVELANPYTLVETAMNKMVSSVTLSAMRDTMEWALSAGSTAQMVSPTLVLTVSSHPLTEEVLVTQVKESAITIQKLDVRSGVFSGIQSARKASIMLLAVSAVPIVSMGKLILELAARSSPMEEQLVFLLLALMMRIMMRVSAILNADQATLVLVQSAGRTAQLVFTHVVPSVPPLLMNAQTKLKR